MDDNTNAAIPVESQWYYDVREIGRRLVYSVVEPTSVVLDVRGAAGIDKIAIAKRCAFIINLEIGKSNPQDMKRVSKNYSIASKIDFIIATATHLPLKNKVFCLFTCFSVIDHLSDKSAACKAICGFSRVVRKLGYVAVTVPNKLFLIGTISMKIKQGVEPYYKHFEQRFTPTELLVIYLKSAYCCKVTVRQFAVTWLRLKNRWD